MHYTLRVISHQPLIVEVTKWENNRAYPLETYTVSWRKGILSAHMCDCPARVPCRHLKMVKDAIDTGRVEELWLWYYEDEEWHRAVDQTVCVFRELIEE